MKVFIFLAFGLLFGGLIIYLFKSDILTVKQVECFTQFGVCPPAIADRLSFLMSRPLYHPLSRSEIFPRLQDFPQIQSLSLHRRWPHTLVASIQLRKPLGAVAPFSGGTILLVDDQGLIFADAVASTSALPRLLSDSLPAIGDRLAPGQLAALKILSQVSPAAAGQITGSLSGSLLTVFIYPQSQILLDINRLLSGWDASLQSILIRSRIDGKIPRKIDLRYTNPIITF